MSISYVSINVTNITIDARKETIADTHAPDTIDRKAAVDSVGVDEPTVTRALDTILDSEVNQNLIKESIQELADRTLATRAAFEQISKLLYSFDGKKYKNNDGTEIEPLRPYWDELHKRYDDILKKSHKDAVIIKNICDQYIKVVLPTLNDRNAPLEKMKGKIQRFMERIKKAEKDAESDCSDLDQLRRDIDTYQGKLDTYLNGAQADPEGRIGSLVLEIDQINNDIIDLKKSITRSTIGTLASGAATIGSVLLAFCPMVAAGVSGVTVTHRIYLGYKLENANRNLKGKQDELANLKTREPELKSVKEEWGKMKNQIDGVLVQLAALSNFWAAARSQCQEACISLQNAVDAVDAEDVDEAKMFLGDTFAGSSYRALSQALAIYVSQMTKLK